jgi:hypothetical protein
MEGVLEAYKRPYDEKKPVVCLDGASRQPVNEILAPGPVQKGQAALYDYEYARNGAANLFMMFEPLKGRREVKVTERRTGKDFAGRLKELAEIQYPDAEKTALVMDNLNTHTPASLCAAFEPEAALRLAGRFEIHFTPKHGSRLNMAGLEIGVMSRQCLKRGIPAIEKMAGEVKARANERNSQRAAVRWQFAAAEARIKLKHLYPKF